MAVWRYRRLFPPTTSDINDQAELPSMTSPDVSDDALLAVSQMATDGAQVLRELAIARTPGANTRQTPFISSFLDICDLTVRYSQISGSSEMQLLPITGESPLIAGLARSSARLSSRRLHRSSVNHHGVAQCSCPHKSPAARDTSVHLFLGAR